MELKWRMLRVTWAHLVIQQSNICFHFMSWGTYVSCSLFFQPWFGPPKISYLRSGSCWWWWWAWKTKTKRELKTPKSFVKTEGKVNVCCLSNKWIPVILGFLVCVLGKLGYISSWWHSWAWRLCVHAHVCVVLGQSRAMWSTLYCTGDVWGQHFPSPMSVSPLSTTHQPPTHPSALTGRARSGNRRSPNPLVTPWHVGSGLSIVAPRWAASLSRFLFCCPAW